MIKGLWNFFSSLWLTVVLAGAVCLVSALGSITVIRNQEFFSALDTEVLIPRLLSGGLGELSLTWWIYLLIFFVFLFAVNTSVCTIERIWGIFKGGGGLKRLFPHMVHVGFLIALAGHLAGSVWGFRSYGNTLFEGKPSPVPYEKNLSIRLDELEVETGEAGDVESLRTTVTLLRAGEEILTRTIGINAPLIYKGIAFYHMDHGETPVGLILDVEGEIKEVTFYGSFTSGASAFTLGEIYPDFAIDSSGRPYSRSMDFRNPFVEVRSARGEVSFLDIGSPGKGTRTDGKRIVLVDYAIKKYAVLTISRDPGIWLIISGSSVLVIGMVLLLFFRGERAELVRD